MSDVERHLERQLTIMLRRAQRVHLRGSMEGEQIDRALYGILCRVQDAGTLRLGDLAVTFGLDPSTITRQVQALERAGLLERSPSPDDGRVSLLTLTERGQETTTRTREYRRRWLESLLSSWTGEEREEFCRLMTKFNETVDEITRSPQRAGAAR